jgi:excinuclease ABC subunit C
MECYDISNISGTDAVGSMVVFTDGVPDLASYRKFSIRTVEGSDDFAMLAEVLVRRFKKGTKLGALPELVILDGGRGQLSAVCKALNTLPDMGVELIALAKERLINDNPRSPGSLSPSPDDARPFRRKPERVFLRDTKDAVTLPSRDPVTNLLARIRDEAHRFAITAHRTKRAKRTVRSCLDDIRGIGPKRRNKLLRVFGSVHGVANADIHEISEKAGISADLARVVLAQLKKNQK